MNTLSGRTAIVTGGGRGIGEAVAMKLAGEGAAVVVNDLDVEPAEQTVKAIEELGGRAVSCAGDITEDGFAEHLIDTAVARLDGLDIVVNNAGYTWDSSIEHMTDEQWDAIINVHLRAPFRILRAAQPAIRAAVDRERRTGTVRCRKVVNISSHAGVVGDPGHANYSAAKAGVVGLTRSLSKEWGPLNVTVNAVAFGWVQTRLAGAGDSPSFEVGGRLVTTKMDDAMHKALTQRIPLGRGATPEDAAGAVYLMCIPESDYITGHTLICGGGLF